MSISKGMLIGIFMLVIVLLIQKNWRSLIMLSLIFFILLGGILPSFSPYTVLNYITYAKPDSFSHIYNRYLGNRFGHIKTRHSNVPFHSSILENTVKTLEKNTILQDHQIIIARQKLKEYLVLRKQTLKRPQKGTAVKNTEIKTFPMEGYLKKSIETIKEHLWFGVGYVSNISAGDSMLIHLLVRGGILGIFIFFILMVSLLKLLSHSTTYHPINFTIILFLILGVGLPTFIQDRTSDIFWCLCCLSLIKTNLTQNPTYLQESLHQEA